MLAAGSAIAQTSPDRPGRVGPGVATSTCIGNGSTPVCAAETLLACMARAETELCRRVGVTDPRSAASQGPALVEYVIDRSSIIRREDITDELRDVDWYKPGYALVEMQRRSCETTKPNCAEESWTDLQVYARPRGTVWDIVTWRGEGDEDAAPEIPDAFTPPPRRPAAPAAPAAAPQRR
jgi:hypothetical protein